MIQILLDTLEGYPFIAERLSMPCEVIYSPQRKRKYFTWLAGAWKAVTKSKKGDVIVAVYDFQGVLCYWIGSLTFRRRKIVGINILLKNKDSLRNKVARFLYRKALKSKRFITTATTREYGDLIAERLQISKSAIPVLQDVFYDNYLSDAKSIGSSDDGYIFCGGRNGRDWKFLIELAAKMPDVKFKISLPKDTLQSLKNSGIDIPQNIKCYCDIPLQDFNQLLARASIIALPLDTEAPAALIVVFQAAAFEKPVIITDTVSTHHYFENNRGIALNNDIDAWKTAITRLISNKAEAKQLAANLQDYILNNCSESQYVAKLNSIIQDFC